MSYQTETNWMDELDSKLRNLEELEAARAKEAWEKHVVSLSELSVDEKVNACGPWNHHPEEYGLWYKKPGLSSLMHMRSGSVCMAPLLFDFSHGNEALLSAIFLF